MAQTQSFNFKDNDSTFLLNAKFLGILKAGLYTGYTANLDNTMVLKLQHLGGLQKPSLNSDLSLPMGVCYTKQGVTIFEDGTISLAINTTGATGRIDYIVLTHSYQEIEGGTQATYSVVQGVGSTEPVLPQANKQIVIGKLTLPPNCTSLSNTGVSYSRELVYSIGDGENVFLKKVGAVLSGDLDANNHKIENVATPENAGDGANKKYVDDKEDTYNNKYVGQSNGGISTDLNARGNKITGLGQGTAPNDSVTKEQLDGKVSKTGDTITGNINMGGHRIENLASAMSNNHAVHLGQLNSRLSTKHPFVTNARTMRVRIQSKSNDGYRELVFVNGILIGVEHFSAQGSLLLTTTSGVAVEHTISTGTGGGSTGGSTGTEPQG